MKKQNIVKENREFQLLITTGICKKNRNFILYFKKNEMNCYRFGISVGKKIGNAVIRNYYKRQMRNIIDHHKKVYSNGTDYIIIIRKNCLEVDYQELEKSFLQLMNSCSEGEKNETK